MKSFVLLLSRNHQQWQTKSKVKNNEVVRKFTKTFETLLLRWQGNASYFKKRKKFSCYNDFLRWDSEVYFYSTNHKKGIVWLELCIDVSGESTLHVRVKLLLGLWTSISKAAYRRKPCTLIMNENNEQSYQE